METFQSHTKHYFVEEFVESDDLKTLLLSKPNHRLEPADVRIYMAEMLEGLAHMHEKGWIYRDLKTGEIGEGGLLALGPLFSIFRQHADSPRRPLEVGRLRLRKADSSTRCPSR